MAHISRRVFALSAAASALAPVAVAAAPPSIANDPAFRAWSAPTGIGGLPLAASVETEHGVRALGQWLERRPAVLALWASWCTPCLLEKPQQAALAQRLAASGAAMRILALQAFDVDVSLENARWMLDRIGAHALPLARASAPVEIALSRMLDPHRRTSDRTVLPSVLLIGGDGLELGHAMGTMRSADGRSDYWEDEATFRFLSRLL